MIFPVIQFARRKRRRVSDIEYLSAIEFGEIASATLVTSSVAFNSTGIKAIITPAAGKFAYITKAYVKGSTIIASGACNYTSQLRNNTSVIETLSQDSAMLGGAGATVAWNYQLVFGNVGEQLNGDGIIDFDINISVEVGIDGETFIQCLIIDDADSPRVP